MNTLISYEARKAVKVGYDNHWRFRVVGQGDVPEKSYYKDEWIFSPVEAPVIAQDRLSALKRSGVQVKGFVIAHEAPRLLTAPAPRVHEKVHFKNTSPDILPDVGTVIRSLVTGLLWFMALIFQVALLDPALIVVLEDGTWLEVMTWYE